jgi:3-phytase
MKTTHIGVGMLTAACSLAMAGAQAALPQVDWTVQTPVLPAPADGDDPAIWLHPTDASRSLVITSVKNGGLRVFDLSGNQVQSIVPPNASVDGVNQASRLNNVDVQYGFNLGGGVRSDVAVFTDRGQDRLRMFRITDTPGAPLQEIPMSAASPARLYPNGVGTGQAIGTQATGYGITLWRDAGADKLHALVNQRREAVVSQFELTMNAGSFVATQVNTWNFPTTFQGTALSAGSRRQFEGMVVDQRTGMLYAGQEDVGVWRINLATGVAEAAPVLLSKEFDPASPLTADVEGLTIRYGANGTGVLLVSSQGNSTFATYDLQSMNHLGSFTIAQQGVPNTSVDAADGAEVTSFALPGFG